MWRLLLVGVVLLVVSLRSAGTPKLRNTLTGHSGIVSCVAWSPDGKTLASGSYDETIRLWDITDDECAATLQSNVDWELSWVTSVAFSPDGRALASGSHDKTVRLWSVTTGKASATLEVHTDWATSVAWSPDGRSLASVGAGTIKLWNVLTGKAVATIEEEQEWICSVAWSPDGESLALGNARGVVKIRNVTNGRTVTSLDAESGCSVLSIMYSPDGKILASANGCTIELWDVSSHESVHTLKGHSCELVTYGHGNYGGQYVPAVKSVAFSPDGRTLASGSQDKTIKLWDAASGKNIATLTGHLDAVESVAFSPDGKTLASGSQDKTIKLWDVTGVVER